MITRLHTSRRRSLAGSVTGEELKMNHRVFLPHSGLAGIIRYLGSTLFSEGSWVGVELDRSAGRNDGSVKGTRYFTCAPGYGLFVRAASCQPASSSASASASASASIVTQSTSSHGNASGLMTASKISSPSRLPQYRSTSSTTTRLTKRHSNLTSKVPTQTPTKPGIKHGSQVVRPSVLTTGSGTSSHCYSSNDIMGRIDDALIEVLNTGGSKSNSSSNGKEKGSPSSSITTNTTMQGNVQSLKDTRRKSSVVMASAAESIEAAVMAALESDNIRNAIVKISNSCVADLKDHVKEMESKLITAADGDSGGGSGGGGVSTYNLLHEPGTTDTEKATSDSGLEKRMKCIETKVEAATSIMKGLSDRVDKVMLLITLQEERENTVPQTYEPELKRALHAVHQLALEATEALVADE